MITFLRRTIPLVLLMSAVAANAQFYKLHGASISVGATGEFSTILNANPSPGTYSVPFGNGSTTYSTTVTGQQQYTTDTAGFVAHLNFHPVAWAGVELNYGFYTNSEVYAFNYGTSTPAQSVRMKTGQHEATAAYSFHPRHIKFQPFVNIGGGILDFDPNSVSSQIRGAGLLETGFDIPTMSPKLSFRVEGRSLYYRAPNFYTPSISTRSWRVTEEPAISAVYRF
jgi:hypothetical protein